MGPKSSPARILMPIRSPYPLVHYLVPEVDYIIKKIIRENTKSYGLEIYIYIYMGNKSGLCRRCGGFALDTIEKGHSEKRSGNN